MRSKSTRTRTVDSKVILEVTARRRVLVDVSSLEAALRSRRSLINRRRETLPCELLFEDELLMVTCIVVCLVFALLALPRQREPQISLELRRRVARVAE